MFTMRGLTRVNITTSNRSSSNQSWWYPLPEIIVLILNVISGVKTKVYSYCSFKFRLFIYSLPARSFIKTKVEGEHSNLITLKAFYLFNHFRGQVFFAYKFI